jgi:4'-phosphopantetheinyl transferase
LALYAITLGRRIGIDVEELRPMTDAEAVAARFFSARENAVLQSLRARQKRHAFFDCWTRKEAYLKATGQGLAGGPERIDVTLTPGDPPQLLRVYGNPREACRWSMRALYPAEGYIGALAVEGHEWRLRCWHFAPDDSLVGPGRPVPGITTVGPAKSILQT